ncbi:hypothetical protein M5K25_003856 [Dendrobium thyrsiflorum]|uniref:Large ribosomal subunit protein uL2 RNA-binding domain-containing protein n=1 Tax=Dendrobium thyrsiflorum TaxID=117978 RepID=A0ABD0VSU1_DENTH
MDGIKYAVFIEKSIRLLGNNQYTSNVESRSTRTKIKHWVKHFFGVKLIAMNSHRLPGKGRRMGHTMHYRCMIITLQPAVDSQVKSIPRKNLIYGQHRYGKGRNARGIIITGHRGGGHNHLYHKIDIRRNEKEISGRIVTIEYDPNRNAYICLIHYGDGEKGAIIGDTIIYGIEVPISMGNALPLSTKIIDSRDMVIWRRQNCLKRAHNRNRPLFQREEDGLFTFNLMISSYTSRKPYALEEACTVREEALI